MSIFDALVAGLSLSLSLSLHTLQCGLDNIVISYAWCGIRLRNFYRFYARRLVLGRLVSSIRGWILRTIVYKRLTGQSRHTYLIKLIEVQIIVFTIAFEFEVWIHNRQTKSRDYRTSRPLLYHAPTVTTWCLGGIYAHSIDVMFGWG